MYASIWNPEPFDDRMETVAILFTSWWRIRNPECEIRNPLTILDQVKGAILPIRITIAINNDDNHYHSDDENKCINVQK